MHKQGSKHRSVISMFKKLFGKHVNVFNVFADTVYNFIKLFSLHWAGPVYTSFCLFYDLFFVCLFACLHAGHDASVITKFCFYVFFYVLCIGTFLIFMCWYFCFKPIL